MAAWASSRRPAPRSIIATPASPQIYEGTNGIQAIDLVTRKVPLNGGATVKAYLAELRDIVAKVRATNDPAFGATALRLDEAIDELERATEWLLAQLATNPRCGARRRDTLSADVRQCRRRHHAGERSARRDRVAPTAATRPTASRWRASSRRTIAVQNAGLEKTVTEGADSVTSPPLPAKPPDMTDLVTVTDDGGVRTVRMNRPDKKNALTAEMYDRDGAAITGAKTRSRRSAA